MLSNTLALVNTNNHDYINASSVPVATPTRTVTPGGPTLTPTLVPTLNPTVLASLKNKAYRPMVRR